MSSLLSGQWPVASGQQLPIDDCRVPIAEWEERGNPQCIDPSLGIAKSMQRRAQDDTRAGKLWELGTGSRERLRELPGVVPASRLGERPRPAMASSGVAALDALTGGLPRGGLTEICGAASSGRTSLLLAALAAATARGEVCALVDVGDRFDPQSAQAADVELRQVLWVRCGRSGQGSGASGQQGRQAANSAFGARHSALKKAQYSAIEQALKATDLLLQAGGFGIVVLDLGDVPAEAARRVPLASWFRFRRAVEHTDTVLVAITREACAKSCAGVVVKLTADGRRLTAEVSHARLLDGLEVRVEVMRDTVQGKKPVQSAARFASTSEWNRVIGSSGDLAI